MRNLDGNGNALIPSIEHDDLDIEDITKTFASDTSTAYSRYGVWLYQPTEAAVPEPSLGLLLGISLVGLVGVGAVRKIKQKKIANS